MGSDARYRVESIFNELCADCSNDIILHGDLHHDNILQSDTSWSVIDPHGYIGDPCAEVGPMIFNPCIFYYESSLFKVKIPRLAQRLEPCFYFACLV